MRFFRLQNATRILGVILTLMVSAPLIQQTAYGQSTSTGTIVGVVQDQSGAVIPGAAITLTDVSTKSVRTTTSGSAGQYVFANVNPSTYTITASTQGFKIDRISNLTVTVGTQSTANFILQVGSTQQTIEVQSTIADLQTLNSTVGSTVEPLEINQLPSLLHDVGTFTELQVGVSPDGSVGGVFNDSSTFTLDGGNNSNDMDGSSAIYTNSFSGDPTGVANETTASAGPTGVMPTPQDSVEEFKVNASNQTADFNNSSGAQVEIVTKRGSDHWHATGYEYYLDNNFSSNTWDNTLSGTPRPSFHYSKYGFAGGGPVIPKNILGGKTYIFSNYQAWRYPQSVTYERAVPSANMEQGLVTFNGTTYDLKALDPRGIGISPIVQSMWNTYEPAGNDPSCGNLLGARCDGTNEIGFKGNMALPLKDNFFVARLDHNFGEKWHFTSSYRYYKLTQAASQQVDIGGGFAGDKLGVPTSTANRPQQPWYLVAGLTTNITSNLTNDFHYSFLRNYWSWSDNNAPPQEKGLGGALEPFGESPTLQLSPYNVDTQSIRTRFWDGKDQFLSDDATWLKGNHMLQFGGQFQHNFDYHQRSDNGGGINFTPTYQLGDNKGAGNITFPTLTSEGYPDTSTAQRVAAAVYGMVTDSQIAYTRSGSTLALNPPLTHAFDQSTIDYYNIYFSDTWHMKPTFTLTYGMGWTLELPPTEATGKQTVMVDANDKPIETETYLAQRKAAALQGEATDPELGFALVGNVGKGLKYPYNPFYGGFSPRVAAAWNPHFDSGGLFSRIFGHDSTVIRGGYGRVYGRLNGVNQVLVPLLGVGLIQATQCTQALAPTTGNPSGSCGPGTPTDSTAFRIGVDGDSAPMAAATPTLPQPVFPGYNNPEGSAAEGLDPNFRPNDVDSFDLTIQRQLTQKTLFEVGYIGRLVHHEYQPINLNAVPYMMVAGEQQFQSAYAALEKQLGCAASVAQCGANGIPTSISSGAVTEPFFEAALAGTGYCTGYASCTAAVVSNEFYNLTQQAVWSIWSDLDGGLNKPGGGFNFPRTMQNTPIPGSPYGAQYSSGVALNASIGHSNYHGLIVSLSTQDWHGLMMHHNFTYSKALGTGAIYQAASEYTANDPFDLNKMYGVQYFNRKLVYNSYMVWALPWYKGQPGLLGRLLGGWSVAPIFTAGNGEPVYCNTNTDAQSFGSGDGNDYYDNEQCVFTSKYKGGVHSHYGVTGGTDSTANTVLGDPVTGAFTVGTSVAGPGGAALNQFVNPVGVFDQVRAPMLGIDTKNPGVGPIIGLPYWNVDMSVVKDMKIWGSASLQVSAISTNLFNHVLMHDTGLAIYSPASWGVQSSQVNPPRQIELGVRVSY